MSVHKLKPPAKASPSELHNHVAQLQKNAIKVNLELTALARDVQELQAKTSPAQGFIYVASPYSGATAPVRLDRYNQVMWYVLGLLKARQWCFSPIIHCHEMAKIHKLPTDAINWLDYNYAMLASARELHVLCLPGWEDSVGVKAEVSFWRYGRELQPKFIEV